LPPRPLSYVLIAEADLTRAARCLEALKPSRQGVLIARDGDEAIAILRRLGSPALLIVDLSLPRQDGVVVMETVRHMADAPCAIIAISPFRDLSGYATRRTDLRISAVVSPTVPLETLREAIEQALQSAALERRGPLRHPAMADYLHAVMRDAAEETARLAGTPGAAVYLKLSSEEPFRAHVTWISSERGLHSPLAAPGIFEWVMETGDVAVLPDLAAQRSGREPAATFHDVVRGIVAVPVITDENTVVGVLCAFDVRPLTAGSNEVEALRALGRQVGQFVAVQQSS
jgi:GAF domain-containing protein